MPGSQVDIRECTSTVNVHFLHLTIPKFANKAIVPSSSSSVSRPLLELLFGRLPGALRAPAIRRVARFLLDSTLTSGELAMVYGVGVGVFGVWRGSKSLLDIR